MSDSRKTNLIDLDRVSMEAFFATMGEKSFRATQVMKWIYHLGVTDIAAMTNLAKVLRERLIEEAEVCLPQVAEDRLSKDGTRKWMLTLEDGNAIEMVFIPEDDRGTLCISSQVGCPLDCGFCSTGKQGFYRNLTVGEMVGQVWLANKLLGGEVNGVRAITNVVLMGMGEPLLNFDNVIKATNVIMDDFGFGLSKRRVTLSTAGVVPALDRLAEVSEVSLALSLHATNDKVRDELVPINRKYPIKQLLASCKRYISRDGRRRITVEYVMLDGLNDSQQDAHALVKLLKGLPSKVNLIPFNPFPDCDYHSSPMAKIKVFRDILMAANITTIIRKTRGEDIDAACGQLVGRVKARRGQEAQQ